MFKYELRPDKRGWTDQQDNTKTISYDGYLDTTKGTYIDWDPPDNSLGDIPTCYYAALSLRRGASLTPILNFLSFAYRSSPSILHYFWRSFQSDLPTNRLTDESDTQLRTTSSTTWFSFDEENLSKTVGDLLPVARFASQGLYSPDNSHLAHADRGRASRECVSSSFCKEPVRLLTTVPVREEGEKNQSGSHSIHSESTRGWAE
ncbi:hypothetical protein SAMN04487967_1892 [Natronorubrum sediminis]|uniref:Uncharacterized protein n=1 Tax=Natronorubrum sediminis TaxID=640943 RepID=A0A1H6FW73_9EURY|nr:hypothetical protein SAMN04487967_1892 [Natronorubrum sediminis]